MLVNNTMNLGKTAGHTHVFTYANCKGTDRSHGSRVKRTLAQAGITSARRVIFNPLSNEAIPLQH